MSQRISRVKNVLSMEVTVKTSEDPDHMFQRQSARRIHITDDHLLSKLAAGQPGRGEISRAPTRYRWSSYASYLKGRG